VRTKAIQCDDPFEDWHQQLQENSNIDPIEYVITSGKFDVFPKPENCDTLYTTNNIQTDGIVIGRNIEHHTFQLSTIGSGLADLGDEVVAYHKQEQQEIEKLEEEVKAIDAKMVWWELANSLINVGAAFSMGFGGGAVLGAEEGAGLAVMHEGEVVIEHTIEKDLETGAANALMSVGAEAEAGVANGMNGALKVLRKSGNPLLAVGAEAEAAVCNISEAGMQVVGEISNGIMTVSNDIEGEIMKIAGDAQSVVMTLKSDAAAIGGSIMELGGEIKSAGMQVVNDAKQTLLTVGKDVEGAFATVKADGMKVKGDIEALSWKLKNLASDAKSFCMTAKETAGDAIYTLGNEVKGTLTQIAGKFKAGTLTFEDLTNGVTQIYHSVGDAAKAFYQIYQDGKDFVQKYADAVKLIYTDATHIFTNLKQSFNIIKGDLTHGIEAILENGKTNLN
jgi:cytochrome c556